VPAGAHGPHVLDGAARAREGETVGDLGGKAALRAAHQHHLPTPSGVVVTEKRGASVSGESPTAGVRRMGMSVAAGLRAVSPVCARRLTERARWSLAGARAAAGRRSSCWRSGGTRGGHVVWRGPYAASQPRNKGATGSVYQFEGEGVDRVLVPNPTTEAGPPTTVNRPACMRRRFAVPGRRARWRACARRGARSGSPNFGVLRPSGEWSDPGRYMQASGCKL
jgi:hypothetical protein